MDAIIQIDKSTKIMSDRPKNQFNFNALVKTNAINVEGDQNITYNPTPKTPAETAKEIQDLLKQLKEGNPEFSEEILIQEVINNNPSLKQRLINALKQGGTEALKVFFPFVSIPVETIRGFLEA